MSTATLSAPTASEQKTAYLAIRAEWKSLANAQANTATSHVRYILTQALLLTDRLGAEAAKALAFRKLLAAFTPHSLRGRKTLADLLWSEGRYGRPFSIEGEEITGAYRALAMYLADELKLKG
ncbi:hypothetical protein CCP3SC15_730011 [Gammaproteobacteria bacterium]